MLFVRNYYSINVSKSRKDLDAAKRKFFIMKKFLSKRKLFLKKQISKRCKSAITYEFKSVEKSRR